jgi:hypothetical protein
LIVCVSVNSGLSRIAAVPAAGTGDPPWLLAITMDEARAVLPVYIPRSGRVENVNIVIREIARIFPRRQVANFRGNATNAEQFT